MERFRICGSTLVVLEAGDGRLLLRTPQLSGMLACRAMIVNLRLTASLEERYERTVVADGFAFRLRGPNGTPIATSPLFASAEAREHAIDTVRRHAASAPVELAPPDADACERARVLAFDDGATHGGEPTAPTTSHEEHLVADDARRVG